MCGGWKLLTDKECKDWKKDLFSRKFNEDRDEIVKKIFIKDNYDNSGSIEKVQILKNGKQWNDLDDPNIEGTCFFQDLREEADFNPRLHHELIRVGKEIERGVDGDTIHNMPEPMINAIIGTLQYFGLSDNFAKQAAWDLKVAKYRIWDWLGMCYTGRLEAKHGSLLFNAIEQMVKLYIAQKDVGGFCWFLRGHDLEVEEPHRCEDCIKSYRDWIKDVKGQGKNPDEFV